MAGGKGSRLYPYSALLPKPLMPLGNMPVLELLLLQLKNADVSNAIIAVNHLSHLIEAFFGDGSRLGMSIVYSVEDKPLGTAGPIGLVLDKLEDTFILTNGDLLTNLNIRRMIEEHKCSGAAATIGSYRRELQSEFGVLEVDSEMRMIGYQEKPKYDHLVSMGLYILQRDAVRQFIVPGKYLDMPTLMQMMTAEGLLVNCHRQDCCWLDIGRPEDCATAQGMMETNPEIFLPQPLT